MPRSPFATSVWDTVMKPKGVITLDASDLPPEPKRASTTLKKKPKAPKQPKKSTLVSRFKKSMKSSASNSVVEQVVPKELTEQQDGDVRSKKRRNSKFHPREGESRTVTQSRVTDDNSAQEQTNNSEFIKRHNAHVVGKVKSTVVLDRMPAAEDTLLKPLLNNNKLGMISDVKSLATAASQLHVKTNRLIKRLRGFSNYIPAKELKQQNYNKSIDSLARISSGISDLPDSITRTVRYLIAKSVFETRHSRTLPNCTLTNLAYEPATTRAAEEQAIRLKRTPLVRSHEEHESEANAVITRHVNTLKTEIQHSHDIASPTESLAAAQISMLSVYRKCIENANLEESEVLNYKRDLKSVTRLMQLVMQEHIKLQEQQQQQQQQTSDQPAQ